MRWIAIALLAATLCVSCSSLQEKPQRELSEAERDSLIGESDLPGSGVVKRALDESKAASKSAAAMDSLVKASGN